MPENRQFRQRLEAWRKELFNQISLPLEKLAFSGCPAPDRLTPEEARGLSFQPMPAGTRWGKRRAYWWFAAEARVPEACAGQRLALRSGLGGEALVYLNGQAVGSIDAHHPTATLFRRAPAGETFRLLIESYAGNGPRLENYGPCPPERQPIPPVTGDQCTVGESWLETVDEDAYQLWMDVDTLCRLWTRLPENSLRKQKIGDALDAFTHTMDFELPRAGRSAACRAAREALAPVLSCHNGSTAPVMHVIGQSHIDLAWLWPMEETYHKAARTYSNQLRLMEEYPEYRFLACEPALLEMLREREPEVYLRMKERAGAGQIQPDGAFYAECDTNIPSGESLCRQLLWGKRWFREELGVESRVAFQPDTFGFSACLPQLLRAFDIPYFATQKLLRADPECERFPYQDFLWRGLDGSAVQALSFFKNNARTDPDNLLDRWEKHRSQQADIDALLYPFGYGDGGGGADRDMLEYLRREEDLEGLPRTRWTSMEEHFRLNADNAKKNTWQGELYLAWHRGTYTVQRKTKTALRDLERALHTAEWLSCMPGAAFGQAERDILREAWKTLLIHQFHDIAAGVGIRDVYAEAEAALTAASKSVDRLAEETAGRVCGIGEAPDAVTALNPLPFARRAWISHPCGRTGYALLPPSGARALGPDDLEPPAGRVRVTEGERGIRVDNGAIAFTLAPDGCVTGLTDLRTGLMLQAPGQRMNDLRLTKNVEPVYDAWELSRDAQREPVPLPEPDSVTAAGADTEELTVVIRRSIHLSPCEETITVRAGEPEIGFRLSIDWRETHKLLKAHFAGNINCEQAIHGIQFGHIRRPAHRSGAFARDRYEVCQQRWTALFEENRGFALLSRAIFGVSCEDGDVALSLLRAPCVPDDTCDRGPQRFAWALRVYDRPFALSGVNRDAAAFDTPPLLLPGKGRNFTGPWAEGALIETVKPAEAGGGVVLRLWEDKGSAARVTLHLPAVMQIWSCSFDERETAPLACGDSLTFDLPAFGIRTLMLTPPPAKAD